MKLKAPFPYFGGKSRVASAVWDRLGDPQNYIEPFCGSCSVLLVRPTPAKIETVNDKECFLANFWRAIKIDPEKTAYYADWPVNEIDLQARHKWLIKQSAWLRDFLSSDPENFDAKVAGWWVWGQSCWIGGGWCSDKGTRKGSIHRSQDSKGVHKQSPNSSSSGNGSNARRMQLIHHGEGVHQKRPILHKGGPGAHNHNPQGGNLPNWFELLAKRLRRVRVCCGDWKRVCTPAVTTGNGLTAVFLDPPYGKEAGRDKDLYAEDSLDVASDVRAWAIENGNNPKFRIALCGYDGEHKMPENWECFQWKASGGYSNRSGSQNRFKERIWFSPHCLKADLF